MATVLNKDLVRESTHKFEDREIMVTLTENQKIAMKLKGMKSGTVSIDILKLYQQLKGVDTLVSEKKDGPVSITKTTNTTPKGNDLVSMREFLNDLRSHNAISTASAELVSHLDGVIASVIESKK